MPHFQNFSLVKMFKVHHYKIALSKIFNFKFLCVVRNENSLLTNSKMYFFEENQCHIFVIVRKIERINRNKYLYSIILNENIFTSKVKKTKLPSLRFQRYFWLLNRESFGFQHLFLIFSSLKPDFRNFHRFERAIIY